MLQRIAPAAGRKRVTSPFPPTAHPPERENKELGEAGCWAIRPSPGEESLLLALKSLERSLESDPDCYDAWAGLSDLFLRMRDVRRAVQCLKVARRLRSGDASTLDGSGPETATA